MSSDEQTRFLQQLAEDLNSKNIRLPSFPDVVISIRTALQDPSCTSERLASVVRTDAVLVARLLMVANSAFHNRASIEILDLNLAISRLGFEVVRNTAITLAVEQIFNASQYAELRQSMKTLWSNSLSLASMCFVIARHSSKLNADNAFLCGLFHEVGKIYILTRARAFPVLMGDPKSLETVLNQWYATVGKSIIEAWGFPNEITDSLDIEKKLSNNADSPATLVDVIHAARLVLRNDSKDDFHADTIAVGGKLSINPDTIEGIRHAYDQHAKSMRQSVG